MKETESSAATARAHRAARCGMDLIDAIYGRRAVREYTGAKVSEEQVRALLDAAVQAPSAVNQQPWAFAVVQDAALLRRLAARAKELTLQAAQPGTPLFAHRDVLEDPDYDVFYGAGTLIAICAAPGIWPANEDCCLAAQNLMLAAHGLGLGTCPIGFARQALDEPAARRELRIPADHSVVMPLVVGHPRAHPAATPRQEPRILCWK